VMRWAQEHDIPWDAWTCQAQAYTHPLFGSSHVPFVGSNRWSVEFEWQNRLRLS